MNQEKLYDADEAAETLLKFDGISFWDVSNRRELLYLIYQRWNKFSESARKKLINRLLSDQAQLIASQMLENRMKAILISDEN